MTVDIAYFDRLQLEIPRRAWRDCSGPGPADGPVEYWIDRCGIRWEEIDPESIRSELKEYGAWNEEELSDDEENRRRIFWIACGNLYDEANA